MVLEEISQLIDDCNAKREALVEKREAINAAQKKLLKVAANRLDKDGLTDLEYYQNQFHIQLINIHDLRRELKTHLQRLNQDNREGASGEAVENHDSLVSQYDELNGLLSNLHSKFETFVARSN